MAVGSDVRLSHRRSERSPGPRDRALRAGILEQPRRGLAPGPRAGQRDRRHRGLRGVAGGEASDHKTLTLTRPSDLYTKAGNRAEITRRCIQIALRTNRLEA